MSIFQQLRTYAGFARGLRGFLRHPITLEEAGAIVQRRLAQREANFLRLVERGIFGYPRSPYLPLLKLAQVELGDVQSMVRHRGLQHTLEALRAAGVYVGFEEFRGRAPVVRDGQVIPVQPKDFDNPLLESYYYAETSGSTGAATRVAVDLNHLAAQAPQMALAWEAYGVRGVPMALWRGILPDSSGLNNILRTTRFGHVPQKWFSQLSARDLGWMSTAHPATYGTVLLARLYGVRLPWPEAVPISQASKVAHWAATAVAEHGACLVLTQVNRGLRVCLAAQEAGLDLTGAIFVLGGEPPTPAKIREMNRAGARHYPSYSTVETGRIAMGCANPIDCNDLHLHTDALALVQWPRQIPGAEGSVDAFNFTSLLLSAPKIMLNVETDDYGIVEQRRCGCLLESYGYTQHIRQIYSFRKLTGEGVTLVGSEMLRILEEDLPARFGGSSQDYQLLEEEDEQGVTRISLIVSPRIELADEEQVIQVVRDALRRGSMGARLAEITWSQAGTLRVKRMEPIWTGRGKLMPLHRSRSAGRVG